MNDDLDRELQTHLDLEAEEQRDAGLTAEQARFAALKTLGNQAHIKEAVRALSPRAAFEHLLQDVRYGTGVLVILISTSPHQGEFIQRDAIELGSDAPPRHDKVIARG